MAGTSMDGIDVAVLRTDGENQIRSLYSKTFEYTPQTRALIKDCLNLRDETDPRLAKAEEALTREHAKACAATIEIFPEIDLIGFHGQTIWHAPQEGLTRQLGNGQLLADLTKRRVVYDFRSNDMRHGGQGAPLLPLYHAARARGMPRPLVVVNIGGVANVTWIGATKGDILAFDTGPGNALINDWMEEQYNAPLDLDGRTAAKGVIDAEWIKSQIQNPYFKTKPPKSLDRNAFSIKGMDKIWSKPDGAATLTMFTATCIALAQRYFPKPASMWIITGGGRHNSVLMKHLKTAMPETEIVSTEAACWNGDALEAEGFAYLAARSVKGLPLTLPQTTGCREAVTGGVSVYPSETKAA